jgi:hypothetical protein
MSFEVFFVYRRGARRLVVFHQLWVKGSEGFNVPEVEVEVDDGGYLWC